MGFVWGPNLVASTQEVAHDMGCGIGVGSTRHKLGLGKAVTEVGPKLDGGVGLVGDLRGQSAVWNQSAVWDQSAVWIRCGMWKVCLTTGHPTPPPPPALSNANNTQRRKSYLKHPLELSH